MYERSKILTAEADNLLQVVLVEIGRWRYRPILCSAYKTHYRIYTSTLHYEYVR